MIIDAKDLIVGRLAAFAAKKALLGEKVDIVNCAEACISGKKLEIVGRFKRMIAMGDPHHGPFIHRQSFRIVKRTIRGMLPYKQYKGKIAFDRVKCYDNIPEQFKNEKIETIDKANIKRLKMFKFIRLRDLSRAVGM